MGTEGFCPAGRAIFLSLNKKKQKINTGAAPLWTRFSKKVKGRGRVKDKMTPVLHLRLRTVARTFQPDVVVLEGPMVKGGGCGWCVVLL